MARLPTPGGDAGDWGDILNAFLEVSHNNDGTLGSNIVDTPQIKNGAVTNVKLDTPTQTQLAQAASAYQKPGAGIPKTDLVSSVQTSLGTADTSVQTVNSKPGPTVTLTAGDVGAASAADLSTETSRAEAAEALLAPLASPALTGTPTAPTPATNDSSTKIATTASIDAKLATLRLETIANAFSRIFVVGHSISAGGGAPTMSQAWHNLVAGMLRAELVHYGRGGAVASWGESNVLPYGQTGDGGIGFILSNAPFPALYRSYKGVWAGGTTYRQGDIAWTGSAPYSWWVSMVDSNTGNNPTSDGGTNWQALPTTASPTDIGHPYTAAGRLPIVEFGLNDLGWVGDLDAFKDAMRIIIAAFSASEVVSRAADPRCTFSGGGWVLVGSGLAPGSGVSSSVANGTYGLGQNTSDTETIVTPTDWPGGYVTVTYATLKKPTTGVFRVQVDGSTVLTRDLSSQTAGVSTPNKSSQFGLRFQVSAGAHTVVIQQTTALSGPSGYAVYTDALILEASPAPPVIVPGLSKFLTGSLYASLYGGGTTASDANVDAWNTALQALLTAEFPNAYFLASSLLDHDPTKFSYDGVHPNAHGHALIAGDVINLLANTVLPAMTTEQISSLARPLKVGKRIRLNFGDDYAGGSVSIGTSWQAVSYAATKAGYTSGTRTIEASITADPGDIIEIGVIGFWNNTAQIAVIDFATLAFPNGVSQTPTFNHYVSSGTTTQTTGGLSAGSSLNTGSTYAPLMPGGPVFYKVRSDDLVLGEVTFRLLAKSTGSARVIILGANNVILLNLANIGQESPYFGQRQDR